MNEDPAGAPAEEEAPVQERSFKSPKLVTDFIGVPIDYKKGSIDSKYRLVLISAQRARELSLGAHQKLDVKPRKNVTTALMETVAGDVPFLTGEKAVKARDKAEKIDFKKLMESRKKPLADLSELEKDLKNYLHEHEKESPEKALDELFSDTDEAD